MHNPKLPAIIAQLLEIHSTEKVQIHMYFGGHVNKITVDVYIPKWENGKNPDLTIEGYVDQDNSFNNFEKEVSAFIKLFKAINQ